MITTTTATLCSSNLDLSQAPQHYPYPITYTYIGPQLSLGQQLVNQSIYLSVHSPCQVLSSDLVLPTVSLFLLVHQILIVSPLFVLQWQVLIVRIIKML